MRRTRTSSSCREGRSVSDLRSALSAIDRRAALLTGSGSAAGGDPWEDFLARPGRLLRDASELGFLTEDEEKSQGDLPDGDRRRPSATSSWKQHLKASLRGYQASAARFALVQRKVIIGDEMGLGKTVGGARCAGPPPGQGGAPLPRHLPSRGGDQLGPRRSRRSPSCAPIGFTDPAGRRAARTGSATAASPSRHTRRSAGWKANSARRRPRLRGGRRGPLHQEPRRLSDTTSTRPSSRLRASDPPDGHAPREPDRGVPQPRRLPAPDLAVSATEFAPRSSASRSHRPTFAEIRKTS